MLSVSNILPMNLLKAVGEMFVAFQMLVRSRSNLQVN